MTRLGIHAAQIHISRVTGGEQHRRSRATLGRAHGELAPVHAPGRPTSVNSRIERLSCASSSRRSRTHHFPHNRPCSRSPGRPRSRIPARRRIVLDHQHHRPAARGGSGMRRDAFGSRRTFGQRPRQIELHRRAVTELAVDLQVSADLLHKAEDHAEAEAGALPRCLVVKNGSKARAIVWRHAGAGIGDGDQHDILPGVTSAIGGRIGVVEVGVGGLDGQRAAGRHGVAGVDRQIEHGAFELRRVGLGAPQAAGKHGLDFDLFAQRPAQQLGHAATSCWLDRSICGCQWLPPREGQQALGQGRRARHAAARRSGSA